MTATPRVAFFPDAFLEVDGVAVVARNYEAFAKHNDIPLFIVNAGPREEVVCQGSVTRIQFQRSRLKFPLDRAHDFDLLFSRHARKATALLQEFAPDVIQITGPSDVGILGALLAHQLKVPLAAFWQTDLPMYAGRRTAQSLSFLPRAIAGPAAAAAERFSTMATTRFYKIPRLLFAPNPEIVAALGRATGKLCLPMGHGVDAAAFHPGHRDREGPHPFTIGYVGRLTAEKNVRWLADMENYLLRNGQGEFRIVIVGQGTEEKWLRANLRHAEFTGVLHGAALSRAYANMDLLAFPSQTETFGLVVLEALASGVPAVVTSGGGPKYTVRHNATGYVAEDLEEFCSSVAALLLQRDTLRTMSGSARKYAEQSSWSNAFRSIYVAYADHLTNHRTFG
ncbi:MAG: glycosyltransferase [Acidobacteriaceae bacterium]